MHPVGSYYISDKADNPSTFIGGTWELLKDVMLIGAGNKYTAGSTGGNDTHSLTKDEMPSHNHGSAGGHTHNRGSMNITGDFYIGKAGYYGNGSYANGAFDWKIKDFGNSSQETANGGTAISFNASKSWTGETSSNGSHTHTTEGSSKAFSILNPYKAVYIWHRTA